MLYTIETKQLIRADLANVWAFMSNPRNLARLTPPYLGFEVLSKENNDRMYPGQIIEYYVKPLLNIKLHWVTEITHVQDESYFVDEQRFGPYAFWHHKHFLRETAGGVEMHDLVHYKLPLALLGKLANEAFVKKQLKRIFDFRYQQIEILFNGKKELI
ncbi:SRPBCC family protein [Niastella koreensis]|uniref:SRPBCC family protein n=1 Tax=Niastella koreensis TaxID=354356 RepID=UPI00031F8CC1|nr:SRPBCC family protein [Niastella koreensis]